MNNEHTNPFIENHQRREAELAKYGLADLTPGHAAAVRLQADMRIRKGDITDEAEIIKVYAEVKQLYLEYLEYVKESDKP